MNRGAGGPATRSIDMARAPATDERDHATRLGTPYVVANLGESAGLTIRCSVLSPQADS
jgi:hypothetical protein